MRVPDHKAQRRPCGWCSRSDEPKILRALPILLDERIAAPILLGKSETIHQRIEELHLHINSGSVRIVDPAPRRCGPPTWRHTTKRGSERR